MDARPAPALRRPDRREGRHPHHAGAGDERMRPAGDLPNTSPFRDRIRELFGPQAEVYVRGSERGSADNRPRPPILWVRLPAGEHGYWVAFPRGRIERDPATALIAVGRGRPRDRHRRHVLPRRAPEPPARRARARRVTARQGRRSAPGVGDRPLGDPRGGARLQRDEGGPAGEPARARDVPRRRLARPAHAARTAAPRGGDARRPRGPGGAARHGRRTSTT